MKTILVPVEQHSTLPSVLETALLVGRSVEGYIEGVAVGPDLRNIIALEVVFAPPMLDETTQREMVETARQRFETFMHAHAVPEARQEPNGLSFGWLGDTLKDDPFIGDYGRADTVGEITIRRQKPLVLRIMVEQGRTRILFLSELTPRCEQIFPHRCCFQPGRQIRQQCPLVSRNRICDCTHHGIVVVRLGRSLWRLI